MTQKPKNHSLFEYLEELSVSPRPSGLDPIVRYFPLKNNGQNQEKEDKSRHVERVQSLQTPFSPAKMSDYDESDDEVFCGPLTARELMKAAKLLRRQKARGTMNSISTIPVETVTEKTPSFSLQTKNETETLEAPPPSPTEKHGMLLEEPEQVVIEEFSLEEACFSGCNLSGLNLSFESGISDPLAVEPSPANHYGGSGEVPTDIVSKNVTDALPGLYTLACISDLAEKLTISDTEKFLEADDSSMATDANNVLTTPAPQKNSNSISHLYSPISPADFSSQYLDAVDESLMTKNQEVSKLSSEEVIDAIVSFQNQMFQFGDSKTISVTNEIETHVEVSTCAKLELQDKTAQKPSECKQDRECFPSENSLELELQDNKAVQKPSECEQDREYFPSENSFELELQDQAIQKPSDCEQDREYFPSENSLKEESFLHEDSLCNEEEIKDISMSLLSSSASPQQDLSRQSSLMNDTIDEMDMILSMGVNYLETRDQSTSRIESASDHKKKVKRISEENINTKQNISSPVQESVTTSAHKYFCTPKFKNTQPFIECQVPVKGRTEDNFSSVVTGSIFSKSSPALESAHISPVTQQQKKYFQSPAMFKTPGSSKTLTEAKSASVGNSAKKDAASRVHVSTPFRVPKAAEPRSADFKHPIPRLPKPMRSANVAHITSPVSQYIRGPVMAPRFAVVRPRSPLSAQQRQPNKLLESKRFFSSPHLEKKYDVENINPNVPAVNLPYVNYDTASSIKVVEHQENKQKPLPNKIKKLMPSPGAVMRHTGRVNIPDYVDGRQEVSILVSHDAIH